VNRKRGQQQLLPPSNEKRDRNEEPTTKAVPSVAILQGDESVQNKERAIKCACAKKGMVWAGQLTTTSLL
jgi:hypothetical protein